MPQYNPQLHPQLHSGDRRRKVRFVNDVDQRFAKGVSIDSSSWVERNKALVLGATVVVVLLLVVVLVYATRRNPSPIAGGGVPAYVGNGPGWSDSVSQFGRY